MASFISQNKHNRAAFCTSCGHLLWLPSRAPRVDLRLAPLDSVEAELCIPDYSSSQPKTDIHTLAESRASLFLFGQCPVWNVGKNVSAVPKLWRTRSLNLASVPQLGSLFNCGMRMTQAFCHSPPA